MSREEIEEHDLRQIKESRVSFVGNVETILQFLHRISIATETPPCRRFAHEGPEFECFVSRVQAQKAFARVRKLFWYSASSCNVSQEIWFEDPENPDVTADPLKAFAVIHVHYHTKTARLADVKHADLDWVDAVNARHIAPEAEDEHSAKCPFFNTTIEPSGRYTYKVFPPASSGDWKCTACGISNLKTKLQCRKDGCSGHQPCEPLRWRSPSTASCEEAAKRAKQIEILLKAADSAVPWRPGNQKHERSAEDENEILQLEIEHLRQMYGDMRKKTIVGMSFTANSFSGTSFEPIDAGSAANRWTEPNWSEMPDSSFPSPPHHILFVGVDDNIAAKISVEDEVQGMYSAFMMKLGTSVWGQTVDFKHTFFSSKSDLGTNLRKYDPVILHFACHGDGARSALKLFGGDLQRDSLTRVIAAWCKDGDRKLRLIIANACDSWPMVEQLAEHVDFVIGHRTPVRDSDAVAFSRELYGALGWGMDLSSSFEFAKLASEPYCLSGRKNANTFKFMPPQGGGSPAASSRQNAGWLAGSGRGDVSEADEHLQSMSFDKIAAWLHTMKLDKGALDIIKQKMSEGCRHPSSVNLGGFVSKLDRLGLQPVGNDSVRTPETSVADDDAGEVGGPVPKMPAPEGVGGARGVAGATCQARARTSYELTESDMCCVLDKALDLTQTRKLLAKVKEHGADVEGSITILAKQRKGELLSGMMGLRLQRGGGVGELVEWMLRHVSARSMRGAGEIVDGVLTQRLLCREWCRGRVICLMRPKR